MAVGLVLRPDVEQANISALRDAYAKMQAISSTDNRSWVYWAGFHGFPNFMCWHHGRIDRSQYPFDLFLPWHRAYLVYFDNATRDQNPDAILPWWDWTSALSHQTGIPAAYATAQVDGQDNPLFSGPTPDMPNDPARRTGRFPGDPATLPGASVVDNLLGLTDFADFTSQLQDVHDQIHGWTGGTNPNPPPMGGDMGAIATSAFDPIFWAHHAMIDRIWYLWQLRNGVATIPPDYLDKVLDPFSYRVQDVLEISRLGYMYSSSTASAAGPQ